MNVEIFTDGTYTRSIGPRDLNPKNWPAKEVIWTASGVLENADQYILQGIRVDVPSLENSQTKPWKTLVLMNGGASGAVGSSIMAQMAIDAAKSTGLSNPMNLRIIVLPHLESMPRQLIKKEESYEGMAKVLNKFLFNQEFNPTDDLNLIGFSAGGAQMIALAAELGDKCKKLVLMDSAGLSEHKNLDYEFTIGTIIALFKKYKGRIDLISEEMGRAWSSDRLVAGSFGGIVEDLFGHKTEKMAEGLGQKFGLDKKHRKKVGLDVKRTRVKLGAEVLFGVKASIVYAPVAFALVVNDAIDGLQDTEIARKIKNGKLPENLSYKLGYFLEKIFVNSPKIEVIISKNTTHSSVLSDGRYWEEVMKKLGD